MFAAPVSLQMSAENLDKMLVFFLFFSFFAAWLAPRTTGERLAQPQVKRDGGLTSNSDSLCGLSACLPCLTGWLLFAPAAKFFPRVFIHPATGCLIHQDGTYQV